MRILFLNPNWRKMKDIFPGPGKISIQSLDFIYPATLLKETHDVEIYDANILDSSHEQILEFLERYSPDVTILTTAPNYLFWRCCPLGISTPKELSLIIKKESDTKLILIGPHPTVSPEWVINECQADFLIRGEPEISLYEFIKSNLEDTNIQGVYGNGVTTNGIAVVDNLEDLPVCDYSLIKQYEYHAYLAKNYKTGAIIEFSRGCKFNCIFCFNQLFRNKYRARPVYKVIEEIKLLKEKYGYQYFYFIDELFNHDTPQFRLLLKELRDLNIQFGCQCRPDIMNEDLLKEMKNAGCLIIEYGIESFAKEILYGLHKNINVKKSKFIIEKTSEIGITTRGFILYGLPDENIRSLETTRRMVWALNNTIFIGSNMVIPYPTTQLFKQVYGSKTEIGKSEWNYCSKNIGKLSHTHKFVIMLYRYIIHVQNRAKLLYKKYK
ncbi:MAG: radical SAM protein [Methanosarcinales archaeon]|nr:radical SAM protein [Methanosarcinales archaeon]